jgi:hypothetical protein
MCVACFSNTYVFSFLLQIQLHYRDDNAREEYEGGLIDMPNFAFSYALALYRVHKSNPSSESEQKAGHAIQTALSKFPSVLEGLLLANEVDISGRSFQIDWPLALGFTRDRAKELMDSWPNSNVQDPVIRACTMQAYELIVRIFVKQNFKLWSGQDILRWIFQNLKELKESPNSIICPLSPALMRYIRSDPADYDGKFQTMPAEANPLDPGLVVHALAMDPNRPRLMQRLPRGIGARGDDFAGGPTQVGAMLAGPPTQIVDPDSPLFEVFWRSALPWNHVQGVPPPPR